MGCGTAAGPNHPLSPQPGTNDLKMSDDRAAVRFTSLADEVDKVWNSTQRDRTVRRTAIWRFIDLLRRG